MTLKFEDIKSDYTRLLKTVKIKKSWASGLQNVANKARANRSRYEEISRELGGNIPWEFIAVIHNLESGMNFNKHLHNGDPLTARTRRVPRGRPLGKPPFTWEESAVDALKMKGLHEITDWTPERICYELERYNGFGYRRHHPSVLSPYLWSGTNHYTRGKYVVDGRFSATAVSRQAGAIGVLKFLMPLDKKVEQKSRKQRTNNIIQRLIQFLTGGGLLAWNWEDLHQIRNFAQDNTGIILLIGAGAAFAVMKYFEWRQKQDIAEGRYIPSGLIEDDTNNVE